MSTSFPPRPSADVGMIPRSVEEREIARQRRRNSQENRRESKLRVRRTRLPGILDAGLATSQVTSGSVDFSSLAAPSSMTYVNDPSNRVYPSQSFGSSRAGYGEVALG